VLRRGFVLLRDVPPRDGMVTRVAETLPHTDNPYRDPVPTLQLLHCLRVADEGGDTGLVDGLAAAVALRAQDAGAYDVLTGTTVRFEYKDQGAELRTSQPLIQLGPDGTVRGVRFSTRVLHARTAFSVTGSRHLQGCYADTDGLASTLEVLQR
jgi:gamma-butyrobetaine dioxygenase